MTSARVVDAGECIINGVRFPLIGPVRTELQSIYPDKLVLGDYTKDSQVGASVVAWSEWLGGIGLDVMRASKPGFVQRAWWSTCKLGYSGHLVLPALATLTAAGPTSSVGAMGELASVIYAAFGTDVRSYDNTADSWGSSLATLPNNATDAIEVRLAGTVYLVFACTTDIVRTSDGAVFTTDTTDGLYFAFWDDRLWTIDNTGQLRYTYDLATWSNDTRLPLPNGSVTGMFVARDAEGEPIIYVSTTRGPYAHNDVNHRLVATELSLPTHPDNGKGTARWRESAFISAGLGIYQYINGANQAIVTIMGPDRDHGLPSDKRGIIRKLVPTHNQLLAILDSTVGAASPTNLLQAGALENAFPMVVGISVGYSAILGWDGTGWEVKWLSGTGAKAISAAHVSNAYSVYRLWWAHNERVYHTALQRDIINPNEVAAFAYAASSEHQTPWFDAEQSDVDKTALELRVEVKGASSTETLAVSYALNYAASFTALGTISSNGITSYLFPNSTTPSGTAFRSIRFQVLLARGATTTLTPDMLSLTFLYRKKLPVKYKFTVKLGLHKAYGGREIPELRAAQVTAIEAANLVEFTFRDDAGNTRNYFVDIIAPSSFEQSGYDEQGQSVLVMAER